MKRNTKTLSVSLPTEFYFKVENFKRKSKWSRSTVVKEALKLLMEKYE